MNPQAYCVYHRALVSTLGTGSLYLVPVCAHSVDMALACGCAHPGQNHACVCSGQTHRRRGHSLYWTQACVSNADPSMCPLWTTQPWLCLLWPQTQMLCPLPLDLGLCVKCGPKHTSVHPGLTWVSQCPPWTWPCVHPGWLDTGILSEPPGLST